MPSHVFPRTSVCAVFQMLAAHVKLSNNLLLPISVSQNTTALTVKGFGNEFSGIIVDSGGLVMQQLDSWDRGL